MTTLSSVTTQMAKEVLKAIRFASYCSKRVAPSFLSHTAYVMFWARLSPCYRWPGKGGMFQAPTKETPDFADVACCPESMRRQGMDTESPKGGVP